MECLESFEDISHSLQSITLAEMDSVALMNRTDTKFMLDRGSALDMLGEIAHGFRILEVNGVRLNRYETLYYDTEDLRFFRLHLNGKLNRYFTFSTGRAASVKRNAAWAVISTRIRPL